MLPLTKALAGLDPGFARRQPTANSRYPNPTSTRSLFPEGTSFKRRDENSWDFVFIDEFCAVDSLGPGFGELVQRSEGRWVGAESGAGAGAGAGASA